MTAFDDFVGLPWRDRGRERDGLDCWGLVRLVYLDALGVALPDRSDAYSSAADQAEVEAVIFGGIGAFRPLVAGSEKAFDFVLMRERPWHIGIVVGRGLMLHMPENKTSVIEPYTTGRHGRRVEGFYRHESRVEHP